MFILSKAHGRYKSGPWLALFPLLLVCFLLTSCTQPAVRYQPENVEPDVHFNQLFSPDSGGVTGADGLFSVLLPDGRSVFLTGDCFLGEVIDGGRSTETKMLNNSMVVISKDGKEASAIYRGSYDHPESLFEPGWKSKLRHWYWPGHAFVDDTILYVFALNMYNDPDLVIYTSKDSTQGDEVDKLAENQWAFQVSGVDLLRFSLPDFQLLGADSLNCSYETDIHFGNCVLRDGRHIYFFGTRNDPDGSHIYRARTRADQRPYHAHWEFYDGEGWTSDAGSALPMKLDISVSEQFSIFRMKDRYVLLTHEKGTRDIYTYSAAEPYGGFANKTLIYTSPEPASDPRGNLSAYNALAHPQYLDGNKLLVSYCLNSTRVRDVFENADKYRGRFIRVPLSMIDSAFHDYQP